MSTKPNEVQVAPAELQPSRPASDVASEVSPDGKAEPPAFNPGWRFYAAFSSLSVITLMAALDATSISVALPIIAQAIRGSAIEAFWAGTSFLLTSTVFQPILASFSHIFGRKPMIYISLLLFTIGCIVAAVANNFTVMLVGRSIQGIGGGGIIVLSEVVVTDMVPLRERGKWFSFLSAMWSIGTVTGPILGGGFSEKVSWRWIFWINLPFLGIGVVMVTFFLTLAFKTTTFGDKLRRIDWIGLALFLASTTGFLIPLTWGGVMYPWDSWRTLVPLIICGVGLIAFILHQEYIAPEPLIRTRVFKSRTAAVVYFGTVVHGIVLWCGLYFAPLYFEAVHGLSPIRAGIALFPQSFTVAPSAVIVGIIIAVTGKYKLIMTIGWCLTVLGYGIMYFMRFGTPTYQWVLMTMTSGIGTGMLFPSMAIAIQAAASMEDQAYAASMFSFIRAFGNTLGVAIGGVIFQNRLNSILSASLTYAGLAGEYSKDAAGLVQILKAMPSSVEKVELQTAYADALVTVWYTLAILAAIALVLNLFAKSLSIDVAQGTEQGFVHDRSKADEEKN